MIHCSVCGTRLYEQTDNYGSFPSSPNFKGWNREENARQAAIADTCESCHAKLSDAIVVVANEIVAANRAVVEQRRAEFVAWREQEKEYARARAAFERDWRARKVTP